MKKRWILIPVVAALVALAVTGGVILAQGNQHPRGGGHVQGLIPRVAEILGLEESAVRSAFDQAIRERQDTRLRSRLDRLVENERLTQEEADTVMQWFQSRPDVTLHFPRVVFHSEEVLERRLARMAEAGMITQEEADQVLAWHQERPDFLPEVSHGPRGRGHGFHGDRDHPNSPLIGLKNNPKVCNPKPPLMLWAKEALRTTYQP